MITRRDFLKGVAAGAASVAALGVIGPAAVAAEAESNAPVTIDTMKYLCQDNRGAKPDAVAPVTAEEYIIQKGDGFAFASMMVGRVASQPIPEEQFMLNKPAWLGDAPAIKDIAYEEDCEILVIGAGEAGSTCALRCQELGADTLCIEVQTWNEYDNYACDMTTYNSKFFLDKGTPEYDPMDIFNEYMRKALGHAHQKIVRDYATRSGEMLDWMLQYIPQEYTENYAHAVNYKGNKYFSGEACGQKSFVGMTQWREQVSNNNMWPFVVRCLHTAMQDLGGRYIYGAQGIVLVQDEEGNVVGAICTDIDGNYFKVNAKAVIVCAGDFGGNPEMRLDLCDQMRNIAWSYGQDRTVAGNVSSGGRDGSGIRMMLWAGATMEAGPRAGQSAGINGKPGFSFGGCWPVFGPDGKRLYNETLTKHGSIGYLDMMPEGMLLTSVVDADWDTYCEYQGYGHEVMDRSNEYMLEKVRADMAAYKTGPDGFPVQAFSRYGNEYSNVYAADTLEELGAILGYEGEALEGWLAEIEHWNEMCEAGKDSDWGCDPQNLFPIKNPPFFGCYTVTRAGSPSGGLCQHAGVCTDGSYNVLTGAKHPIKGLFASGNSCGQRYAVQYHTPTAGNSCGTALVTGYLAAECAVAAIK